MDSLIRVAAERRAGQVLKGTLKRFSERQECSELAVTVLIHWSGKGHELLSQVVRQASWGSFCASALFSVSL